MSNKHKDLQDDQLHVCKGHEGADAGTHITKDEQGEQLWEKRPVLYPVLQQANPNAAPPAEVTGNIYLLVQTGVTMDVNTIAWQSGTTVRYTMTGDFTMLGSTSFLDYLHVTGATNPKHNGSFVISNVNAGAGWVEITNATVTSSGDDEAASPATATTTHANWDGANTNEWVRFNGTLWYGIIPFEGLQVFDKNINATLVFNGTSWTTSTVAAASETVAGIAEIATQAETNTGTDDERIVTPLKLATWWTAIKAAAATISGVWTFTSEKFRIKTNGASWYHAFKSDATANQQWTLPDEGDQTFASRTYVDNVAVGLKWKQPVIAASTAAGTLASDFENGDTVDGVVLTTGDRILIKNQATETENGIYIVAASGAPTRATDADTGSELVSAAVFVQQGTANADKAFVCTNDTITIGATNIVFTAFASVIGALIAANNLSDVASALTAFNNIKQAATTSATGVVELATDGENAADVVVQGNDSRLSNSRNPKLSYKNFTPASNTATTSEEILHSHEIAAGDVAAGDMIEFYTNWLISASVNNKTYRAYINTSNSLSGATLIAALVQNTITIAGDNFARFLPVVSDTSLECFGGAGNATRSPYAVTANTTTTVTVPSVSAGFWLIITGQKASSGETNSLRWSMIEIHKP